MPISIQHLFRFDLVIQGFVLECSSNFNTTLVSVRLVGHTKPALSIKDFNTTLVSVRLKQSSEDMITIDGFQYNTCFGSTQQVNDMSVYSRGFQYNTCFGSTQFEQSNKGERLISIQHLFRFDNYRLGYAKKHRYISIQHLFRFDLSVHSVF